MSLKLKSYLKRLTNITTNSRLLLLLRLNNSHFLDSYELNFNFKGGAFSIVDSLIKGIPVNLCQYTDSRDQDINRISNILNKIVRNERLILEEKGTKDLYFGWPFVQGKFSDGTPVRCPLIFFAITLQIKNGKWQLIQREGETPFLNKSFLLAYSYYNKINIDESLLDRNLEDFDKDSTIFRTSLYELLKESEIEINFNQENFQDKLQPFEKFKKLEFIEKYNDGKLKLFPEAVIGIFPQASTNLAPDYNELLSIPKPKDIDEFFLLQSKSDNQIYPRKQIFSNIDEEHTFTPFKMDAYQENAFKAIKNGYSIVVQGPPGTGKSELICNLIADYIASGKKILVVSQKKAALDVVYHRLGEKDISPFVGLVHDYKNDRKELYDKIIRQINHIDEYKKLNNSLDSIQLERNFIKICRRIDQIKEELEEFRFALFDEKECGMSVKELYLSSNIDSSSIELKEEYKNFNYHNIDDFINLLNDYFIYLTKYDNPQYIWAHRKSFSDYKLSDLTIILDKIKEIPVYLEKNKIRISKIISRPLKINEQENLHQNQHEINKIMQVLDDEEVFKLFKKLFNLKRNDIDILWFKNIQRILLDCYNGLGIETTLTLEQIGEFHKSLEKYKTSKNSFFKWNFFSKENLIVKKLLNKNGLKDNKEGLSQLTSLVDNRLNFEHNKTKLGEKKWVFDLPKTYSKQDFIQWFSIYNKAIYAKLTLGTIRNIDQYIDFSGLDYYQIKEKIENLLETTTHLELIKKTWMIYLTTNQIEQIEVESSLASKMSKSLKRDFDSLCEYDLMKKKLNQLEKSVINKLTQQIDLLNPNEAIRVFNNSIRLAWIEHIEIKYPILRSVSSKKLQNLEAELFRLLSEKSNVIDDMLLVRVREITYQNEQLNRLNNVVTYRDLYHQVSKKRRIWPIRKLVAHHFSELIDLIPCWLASPESVSGVFPMEELFDLVIFDEASQCFSEQGIPAMYRAKKVLIAGDNKQLRPNDFYKIRLDQESDDPDLEVESLLELADRYLTNIQLNGHYRSQSIDLIHFSNHHFYDNKLKMIPHYKDVNTKNPGIEYIKVDGYWNDSINDEEAKKVIFLMKKIFSESKEISVGVVTFNAKQQQYILDLIDEDKEFVFSNNWFVKNIENVQGNEKDMIIFSTGYAPDKNGKMSMKFGSLNTPNGENRLNVAITRARKKIIVVSSINPNQFRVDHLKNKGPKLLKKYLTYAELVSNRQFRFPNNNILLNASKDLLKNHVLQWIKTEKIEYVLDDTLPWADIVVNNGNEFKSIILTDDNTYFQSISEKDAHYYLPLHLKEKCWRYQRVFSREWWMDNVNTKEKILRFIKS